MERGAASMSTSSRGPRQRIVGSLEGRLEAERKAADPAPRECDIVAERALLGGPGIDAGLQLLRDIAPIGVIAAGQRDQHDQDADQQKNLLEF